MRAPRLIEFAGDLLEAGQHPDIASVEPWSDPGTVMSPCGLKVTMRDGRVAYIKVTRSSASSGDDFSKAEHIPYPDYQIPEGVRTCHQTVSVPNASRS